ncbi:hypothetical protein RCL1_008691 [Eukaryota sp. TZLM3-RCL]
MSSSPTELPKYTAFREVAVGSLLSEVCEEFLEAGLISSDLIQEILAQYDKSLMNVLSQQKSASVNITGTVVDWKNVTQVYTYWLEDVQIRGGIPLFVDKLMLVALNGNPKDSSSGKKRRSGSSQR